MVLRVWLSVIDVHVVSQHESNFEQYANTPKVLANFSPGLERSDNPG